MHNQQAHHDNLKNGSPKRAAVFLDFVKLIAHLRSPEGCPWDREQTHQTLTANMIEEAFEAVDAIETGSDEAIKEELGDVLLQVILHAQIAEEAGTFSIDEVIEGIHAKIVRRHPHVFGDQQIEEQDGTSKASQVIKLWGELKREEKQGLFDSLSFSQPALMLADDVSKKAVSVGFEWPDIADVREKLDEELNELSEVEVGSAEAEEEIGDVLFTAVNLARKYKVNPEQALRATCRKFTARWAIMERYAQQSGVSLDELDLAAQDELWQKAKAELEQKES